MNGQSHGHTFPFKKFLPDLKALVSLYILIITLKTVEEFNTAFIRNFLYIQSF